MFMLCQLVCGRSLLPPTLTVRDYDWCQSFTHWSQSCSYSVFNHICYWWELIDTLLLILLSSCYLFVPNLLQAVNTRWLLILVIVTAGHTAASSMQAKTRTAVLFCITILRWYLFYTFALLPINWSNPLLSCHVYSRWPFTIQRPLQLLYWMSSAALSSNKKPYIQLP